MKVAMVKEAGFELLAVLPRDEMISKGVPFVKSKTHECANEEGKKQACFFSTCFMFCALMQSFLHLLKQEIDAWIADWIFLD